MCACMCVRLYVRVFINNVTDGLWIITSISDVSLIVLLRTKKLRIKGDKQGETHGRSQLDRPQCMTGIYVIDSERHKFQTFGEGDNTRRST